ncbi:MAG: peptide ABC transporter substrate-binding protein, partial [Chloroflexota bacterium]|nr:peptide ABC transporter substrate-binding protein [Chloroflexota bacterium]
GSSGDAAVRQKSYDQVNALVKQHVPMVPIAHGGSATAFKAGVQGAQASPLTNELFYVTSSGTDQFVWMQGAEPISLWCGDETDGETLRACDQMYEPLMGYKINGADVVPGLAEKYTVNADLTEWTFTLRKGVKFFNGAELDANDVVATYGAQWDAKSVNHKGNTGVFEYFGGLFGAMLNKPK